MRNQQNNLNERTSRQARESIIAYERFAGWYKAIWLIAQTLGCFLLGACVWLTILVILQLTKVPNLHTLANYAPGAHVDIYDRNDQFVTRVAVQRSRTVIPLPAISAYMVRSLLCAEDRQFYSHHGFAWTGIVRALLSNLFKGRLVEGGSTVTQQLAKNMFFDGEKRTLDLKIAELLTAWQIESIFPKEKILELYLNRIYFGGGAYGVEEAAHVYFDVKPAALTLAQSAYLAGIIRYPSTGLKKESFASNRQRQKQLIADMVKLNFVSQMEANVALAEPIVLRHGKIKAAKKESVKYPYYVSAVINNLRDRLTQQQLERLQPRVYTWLDCTAQENAEKILEQDVENAGHGVDQGALVAIDLRSGGVLSLVGGVGNFEENQWNCAINPHTAGSTMKPFVYLAAIQKGLITESSPVDDSPLIIAAPNGEDWCPSNYDHRFMGKLSAARSLALSRNLSTIRIAQAVGIGNVIAVARACGITSDLDFKLPLALGCSGVTPLDLATAYATIARGGLYRSPHMIRLVVSDRGQELFRANEKRYRAVTQESASQLINMLQDAVSLGTASMAKIKGIACAGKTGTSDDSRDLWFVGFTPDVVASVWLGNKDNKPIGGRHMTGGTVAAKTWRRFIEKYYETRPVRLPGLPFATRNASLPLDSQAE